MKTLVYGMMAAALSVAALSATPAEARPVNFEVTLGDVQFGYTDGYYDHNRHWHRWHNSAERRWYQEHHHDAFFQMTHSRDRDHNRDDWRHGKRNDWH
jgi:hypothetical protein